MSDYVCKHCGSTDIVAEAEARRSEIPGRIRERGGKPYFDEDTFAWDDGDFDVMSYICECGASDCSLEKLVIERQAFEQPRHPCGRCDHAATEHELLRGQPRDLFVRQPMPCNVEGCECHDYYDLAVALPVAPGQMEMAG